jgi:tRNA dimethylallyltransferase
MNETRYPVVCLMGPTASRKTELAVELCKRVPCEVVSVDSALVYRGMDIGTAKPPAETLERVPHRLVDIRDPEEPYSAGDFARDAASAIKDIRKSGRIPLLAGGTMLYFRALRRGIAELPAANPALRGEIDAQAAQRGWPALHAELAGVDPGAAARIAPGDRQRIQRAIEVYRLSGRSISEWQQSAGTAPAPADLAFIPVVLMPAPRAVLHERIEMRLKHMIANGFPEEVRRLMARPGLTRDAPSMRAVGYRQLWSHAAGECSLTTAEYRALVATRQLAKRQTTWLRSEAGALCVNPLEANVIDAISAFLIPFFRRLG